MKDKLIKAAKFLLFLFIGGSLFYIAYKDQDINEISIALKDADYLWIGLSVVIGLMSHASRALRWNILLAPLGYNPKKLNTFFSIMIMYLANLAFPRMGEVTRCGILKKYEDVSFSKALGTVFVERIIDFIMLFVLFIIVFISQFNIIIDFLNKNVSEKYGELLTSPVFYFVGILCIAGGVIFFILVKDKLKKTSLYKKVHSIAMNFVEGIKSVGKLERRGEFIIHSVFIYLCYYLSLYVCFFAFEATENLSPMVGLTVFVLASFGMVAPAPGGIGTWHIMTISTLLIYQTPEVAARAFAFAVHGSMTLLLIVGGFISVIALPIYNSKKDIKNN